MSIRNTERRFGLDILRAGAISLVLASHMANGLEWLGFYGVEIFFVLSGFLIGGILLRTLDRAGRFGPQEFAEFLRRRWWRTLPNYYLFLALFTANQHYHPIDGEIRAREIPWYLLFLQNFAWPRPSFFGVSWSLCVEEWFYLLMASGLLLSLRLLARRPRQNARMMLFVAVVFIAAPLVLRLACPPQGAPDEQRLVVIYRLDAIMYGVVVAVWKTQLPTLWVKGVWSAATVGGVILVGSGFACTSPGQVEYALLLSAVPLGLSLFLPLFDGLATPKSRCTIIISCVSVWSYSIYLSHMLIYSGLKPVVAYDSLSDGGKVLYKLACLALILAASAATYHYFEKPLTELRERRQPGR